VVPLNVTAATLVSLAVSPLNASVTSFGTQQYSATGTYTDGSTQDITSTVTWASDTIPVATISNAAGSNGLASTAAAGSANVSAAFGGVNASTALTVEPLAFTTPGTYSWTVPAGVTSVQVVATGAGGGAFSDAGGNGGTVTATLSMVAGDVLTMNVGAGGAADGNGTSAGGGSSNVNAGTANQVIAGGGGGAGARPRLWR
jgi:hypothetical protein